MIYVSFYCVVLLLLSDNDVQKLYKNLLQKLYKNFVFVMSFCTVFANMVLRTYVQLFTQKSTDKKIGGLSLVGRALLLHGRGQRFESASLHQIRVESLLYVRTYLHT